MKAIVLNAFGGIENLQLQEAPVPSSDAGQLGLSTSFGNASVDQTTRNALGVLELAGTKNVPVASSSLIGIAAQSVAHVHGHEGMADCNCLPNTTAPGNTGEPAALQLLDLSVRHGGDLVVLSLGPLTNIALAVALDPRLVERVAHLVIMGGNAMVAGNATPAAEANVLADPVAADRVLGERWKRCTMVGLDVTQQAILSSGAIDRLLLSGAHVSQLARPLRHYQAFYQRNNGINGICLHDPTAMAYLLKPSSFETRAWPLRVQTSGLGVGKTWPSAGGTDAASPLEWEGRPLVEVCTGVDVEEVVDAVEHRLGCPSTLLPANT
jgi:purine nucleosidase